MFIRKSFFPWASDSFIHTIINYRQLNNVTAKNKHHMFYINDLFYQMQGAVVFSNTDLKSCYHQLRIQPVVIPNILFRNHYGHYKFLLMSFGLINTLLVFIDLMILVFRPYLDSFVIVFVDDIFFYPRSKEKHEKYLRIVLYTFRDLCHQDKFLKCVFY